MKIHRNISEESIHNIISRPLRSDKDLRNKVEPVLKSVREDGDAAIRKYTKEFDNIVLDAIEVSEQEKSNCAELIAPDLKTAITQAANNIRLFHEAQKEQAIDIETMPGVRCWRKSVPIEKVGLYVPGGNAPLFSTVLMLGIPAQIAGCKEILICTPPSKDNTVNAAILYAAQLAGIQRIFKIGGAQAIAAMAYGTTTVPKVHKIFGPGNQYVSVAKQIVNTEGVAIDLVAGPSEILILADQTARPDFIAADMLAQAEHGNDSHCVLVTPSEKLLQAVQIEISKQAAASLQFTMLQKSISNFEFVCTSDIDQGIAIANAYAPEHLVIVTTSARSISERIVNAGSVFIGNNSPVSIGDYASGTNHTLPTNRTAMTHSGVSLDSFIKKITFQELNSEGLAALGPTVMRLAEAERLPFHAKAVAVRLDESMSIL